MLLAVTMVPKPVAILPADNVPVPVILPNVPAARLAFVICPFTTAEPLYCSTSPLTNELSVRVVP